MQMCIRIIRNSIVTLIGYIFMKKDHKSSLELNKSILLVYIVFQIFYFENLLIFTCNNRIVGFSVMSHIQIKFYKFLDIKMQYKIILFIITYIYFAARFYFEFKETPL